MSLIRFFKMNTSQYNIKQTVKEISIIIATFNAEKTLERCLESIKSQKREQIELIIADGKSTDETLNILTKYSPIIDKIICEPDQGIYDAWNKAIKHSNGKWLMFIGADDYLAPDALNTYLDLTLITNHEKIDFICSNVMYISKTGQPIKKIGGEFKWNIFKRTMNVAHVASLHSINLFKQVGFYNLTYRVCADYELLMRKRNDLKTLFIPKVTAYMQTGGMSFSIRALKEAREIRQKTGKRNQLITNIEYLLQLILFMRAKPQYEKSKSSY